MIADIIDVHVCHEEHTGKIKLITDLPGLLSTDFDTGFAGYDNDRSIGSTGSLFHLSDKTKKARCIHDINLALLPLYGVSRHADRETALLLFFVKIADRIMILGFAHSIDRSGCECHRLKQ